MTLYYFKNNYCYFNAIEKVVFVFLDLLTLLFSYLCSLLYNQRAIIIIFPDTLSFF